MRCLTTPVRPNPCTTPFFDTGAGVLPVGDSVTWEWYRDGRWVGIRGSVRRRYSTRSQPPRGQRPGSRSRGRAGRPRRATGSRAGRGPGRAVTGRSIQGRRGRPRASGLSPATRTCLLGVPYHPHPSERILSASLRGSVPRTYLGVWETRIDWTRVHVSATRRGWTVPGVFPGDLTHGRSSTERVHGRVTGGRRDAIDGDGAREDRDRDVGTGQGVTDSVPRSPTLPPRKAPRPTAPLPQSVRAPPPAEDDVGPLKGWCSSRCERRHPHVQAVHPPGALGRGGGPDSEENPIKRRGSFDQKFSKSRETKEKV